MVKDIGIVQTVSMVMFLCASKGLCDMCASCDVSDNAGLTSSEQQGITGTVDFSQADSSSDVTITVSLTGFNASDSNSQHGFHIHSGSDNSYMCNNMGGHFNPYAVNHGSQTAAVRHVGDLGNIGESGSGSVSTSITDSMVTLTGNDTVIGRSIVIHEQADDLGLGGDAGSLASGNAGTRIACCVITSTVCAASSLHAHIGIIAIAAIMNLLSKF